MNDALAGGAVVIFVIFLLAFLGLAISAVVLRAACGVVGEEAPPLGKAMLIVFAAGLAQSFVAGALGTIGLDGRAIGLLVSAGTSSFVYSKLLPTDISKGAMIWLAQIVVAFALGFLMVMALVVLGVGAGSLLSR